MPGLLDNLVRWIDGLGDRPIWAYGVIFAVLVVTGAGLPVTEELVVVTGGFLLQQYAGQLHWWWMFAVCYTGILIADTLIVWAGRYFGRAVLHRRWVKRLLHPRRLLWARHRVGEHGMMMIVISRFIPGSRYATLLLTGMMHLPWWRVWLADGVAAVFSVGLQLLAGWWLGRLAANIHEMVDHRGLVALIMLGIGLVLAVMYVGWLRRFSGGGSSARS